MELTSEEKSIANVILSLQGEFSLKQAVDIMEKRGCYNKELIIDVLNYLRDTEQITYNKISDSVWAYRVG